VKRLQAGGKIAIVIGQQDTHGRLQVKDAQNCRDRMLRPEETIGTKEARPPADSHVRVRKPKAAHSSRNGCTVQTSDRI
jgi:hypothetical protein